MNTPQQRINELEKRKENIIRICSSYGYSREQTIKDLNNPQSGIQIDTLNEYTEIQAELKAIKETRDFFKEEFIKRLKEELNLTFNDYAMVDINRIIDKLAEELL